MTDTLKDLPYKQENEIINETGSSLGCEESWRRQHTKGTDSKSI